MLILARKAEESVQIADNITITVLEIRDKVVRFGIEAPRNIPVHRAEVYEALQAAAAASEGEAAA